MSKQLNWMLLAASIGCQPVSAAELSVSETAVRVNAHRGYHQRVYRIPETHVVEVAVNPLEGRRYIINGAYFTAASNACRGWAPKQRLRLLSGEWHGRCTTAVFHNLTLGRTCEMYCG
jgi:hypothetical protein